MSPRDGSLSGYTSMPNRDGDRGHRILLRPKERSMEAFTVSVKIAPANKATPSVGTTHVCYAADVHALSKFFIDGMTNFEGPPGTEPSGVVSEVMEGRKKPVE